MSTTINDIFRLANNNYTARQPAKPPSVQDILAPSARPASSDVDKVTLSQLAQSLKGAEEQSLKGVQAADGGSRNLRDLFKGETAKLFNGLDKQSQDQLQGFLDNGSMSAREIELGLQGKANLAISLRAAQERPRSAEEISAGEEYRRLDNMSREFHGNLGIISDRMAEISHQYSTGLIKEEEFKTQMDQANREFSDLRNQEEYKNISGRAGQAFSNMFEMMGKGMKKLLGNGPISTEEQFSASQKLANLGFGNVSTAQAFRNYAQEQEKIAVLR